MKMAAGRWVSNLGVSPPPSACPAQTHTLLLPKQAAPAASDMTPHTTHNLTRPPLRVTFCEVSPFQSQLPVSHPKFWRPMAFSAGGGEEQGEWSGRARVEAWQVGNCRAGKWMVGANWPAMLELKLLGPHLHQNVQLDVAALAPALCSTHSKWEAGHSGKTQHGVWCVPTLALATKKQPHS